MLKYGEEIKTEPDLKGQVFGRAKNVQTWAVGGQGETLEDFEEFIQKLQGFKARVTEFLAAGGATERETAFQTHPAIYERPTEIEPPVCAEERDCEAAQE